MLRRISARLLATSSLDARCFGALEAATDASPEAQCEALLAAISDWLKQQPLGSSGGLQDAVFAELQVRDLACFEAVNAVYTRHFKSEPPPRICIETPLPSGLHLRLRLLLRARADVDVERLRVQSISTWAMACIGPYSQAARVDGGLLTAGVIGLVPHTMAFPRGCEAQQALQAAAAAAEAAGDGDAPEVPAVCADWEAELWMLMRSLWHVLLEMRSKEVCLAQVYVASSIATAGELVRDRVASYLRRECPRCVELPPIMTCTVVPKLPKGGLVEVNVICREDDDSDEVLPSTEKCQDMGITAAPQLAGLVASSFRRGPGKSWIAVAEYRMADGKDTPEELSVEAVCDVARGCTVALWEGLREQFRGQALGGVSLLAQFSISGAHDAVAVALSQALDVVGASDSCAVSRMEVTAMPARACFRLTALAGGD